MAHFEVSNTSISSILTWIKDGDVAIPDIQRPFVWETYKVRDLIDSLYKGFPVGYIIVWQNPDARLKDGSISVGKKILIDGQQRVTALRAALIGELVMDDTYTKRPIRVAFNPITEKFETLTPAIEKDSKWISDISILFSDNFDTFSFVTKYCAENNINGSESIVNRNITHLIQIKSVSIGMITLDKELDIEEVTDIFIRINSKGDVLSQSDFAMSKIASDEKYGGIVIRKMIDYFCHFIQTPADFETIKENDKEFADSPEFQKIKWVVNLSDDIYIPTYTDVLRVAFTHVFGRGKISDLVALLSGRNFETRTNEEEIAKKSFEDLRIGVEEFVNETNFKRYLMILRSVGIIDASLLSGQNAINMGYILYLLLKDKKYDSAKTEKLVRKWILLSMLTGRYSGSSESAIDADIKRFIELDPEEYILSVEKGELSDAFWDTVLIDRLNTNMVGSRYYKVFLIAQAKKHARGFLSTDIDIKTLIEHRGDVHHLFPKKYLQNTLDAKKSTYNQIANLAYAQSEINIRIKDDAPNIYMQKVMNQIETGKLKLGGICDKADLEKNYKENCIPDGFENMTYEDYQDFLAKRRVLMADYIKNYYYSL